MTNPIKILDHPVYGLQNRYKHDFVKTLWFFPDHKCSKCSVLGSIRSSMNEWSDSAGDWNRCVNCIITHILRQFHDGNGDTPEYNNYWKNLYLNAIKKFLRENPHLALES